MSVIEKLINGWWWMGQCFEVWSLTMKDSEDDGFDFFCHICTDYNRYVEEYLYD